MLDVDITALFQIIGYFVLLAVLHPLLYKPVLKLLKERQERIGGSLKSAEALEKEVNEGMAAYEKRIKEATAKGLEEKKSLMQKAVNEEKTLLEKGTKDAAEELAATRRRLVSNKGSVLEFLKKETGAISKNIAEKILDRKVVAMLIAFSLLLLPLIAQAAEHEEEHHGPSGEIWRLANFIVLAIGAYIAWRKVLRPMLDKRAADIEKAMADAKAALGAAEKKTAEYKEKLAALEGSIAEISGELMREGEAERQSILAEAEKAIQKFKALSQRTIEQEIQKARLDIQSEVAETAVKMAEEILRKELKPEDQERLVKGYLDNLRLH